MQVLHLGFAQTVGDLFVWLPDEKVLYTGNPIIASAPALPWLLDGRLNDSLETLRRLRKLVPDGSVVVPGHGSFGTTHIFDENERYFGLLIERVGALVRQGRSLEQIHKELRMPEYAGWAYQERMPTNIDAAYRAVTGR